jgi:hypothetical protein
MEDANLVLLGGARVSTKDDYVANILSTCYLRTEFAGRTLLSAIALPGSAVARLASAGPLDACLTIPV